MISILVQVENLPIKPFEISEIEGLKGWVITLAFLTLVMIMKEVFKLFSDRKRSKEMELLMNLTVEQKAFNEKIANHFQTIANKYSKNSSDSQILTISKVLFDNASRHLQLFQRKIVEHNHIAGNEEIVKQKIYDEVNNTMNNSIVSFGLTLGVLIKSFTTLGKVYDKYVRQEPDVSFETKLINSKSEYENGVVTVCLTGL